MTDLSSLGASSRGVWTRRQAQALLTPGQIGALVESRAWQVPWRGVYADGGSTLTSEQQAVAAVLAAGGEGQPLPRQAPDPLTGRTRGRLRAVACGRTAARVWQLPLIDDDDPATGADDHLLDDVAVSRHLPTQSFRGRRLLPHQLALRRSDLVRLDSGLWLTTRLRTLIDCAALIQHEALVCALDAALHAGHVSTEQLMAAAAARKSIRFAPALRRAVAAADARAESPAETLARLLLLPVLPDLEPQVELFDRAARLLARFDLGDRRTQLAVEADGTKGHAGAAMVAKDRRRDRVAEAHGWTTERVTWFELRREQQPFVRRIVQRHGELVRVPRAS